METRKITVLDSETQSRHEFNTDVTTFGELKELVRQAGINIQGKDWLEGFTKTSPRGDSSILPSNINWKGTMTNDLVYMITNTNKKIDSGVNRKEIYIKIKELGLADKIKEVFNENYTRLKTSVLEEFVNKEENVPTITSLEYNKKVASAIANMIIALDLQELVEKYLKEASPTGIDLSDDELKDIFD